MSSLSRAAAAAAPTDTPRTPDAASEVTVAVKAFFRGGTDLRRLRVALPPGGVGALAALKARLAAAVEPALAGEVKLALKDEDGDMITLATDDDVVEAVWWDTARPGAPNTLKIVVTESDAADAVAAAPSRPDVGTKAMGAVSEANPALLSEWRRGRRALLESGRVVPAVPRKLALRGGPPVKVAMASICSHMGDTEQNLIKHIAYAENAARQGAKIVMYPEGSVHSLWCTFDPNCETVGLTANSEPLDGPSIKLLTNTCARLGIAMCVGFNHYGLAAMPHGKALNAWAMIDGTGIVHLQHKAHPTWCEDKFYRGGGDYFSVWEWAGAPGRKFAAGICADRGYVGDALYKTVAAQGCNVFFAPSAGAGHTRDWTTLNWGFYTPEQLTASTAVIEDRNYPSFRPKAFPTLPTNWFDVMQPGWDGKGPDRPWVDAAGGIEITGKGGLLEGASFLYCNARDVRDKVMERPDLAYFMKGGSAAFTNGVCTASDFPFTPDGETSLETLTFCEI